MVNPLSGGIRPGNFEYYPADSEPPLIPAGLVRATTGTIGIGLVHGARASPVDSCPGPGRAGPGSHTGPRRICTGLPVGAPLKLYESGLAWPGPDHQAGFIWALLGSLGLSVWAPLKSMCKPSQVQYFAQTGLGPDTLDRGGSTGGGGGREVPQLKEGSETYQPEVKRES